MESATTDDGKPSPPQPAAAPAAPAAATPADADSAILPYSPSPPYASSAPTPTPADQLPPMEVILLLESLAAALPGASRRPSACGSGSSSSSSLDSDLASDPVPTYTPTAASPLFSDLALTTPYDTLLALLQTHPSLPSLLSLPLTSHPSWRTPASAAPRRRTIPSRTDHPDLPDTAQLALRATQRHLLAAFFAAASRGDAAAVARFVGDGLASPDAQNADGGTPLLAAAVRGRCGVVRALGALGADVNALGPVRDARGSRTAKRTALMAAAGAGRLAVVRLLREELGADDGVVAPDGQIALRLAADGGHADVVGYLPARRGGAWARWKTHHAGTVRRVRRAAVRVGRFFAVLLWHLPKLLVWDAPEHFVVRPLRRAARFCWANKHRFGGWCKRQAAELPRRATRAGKAVWKGVKEVPGFVKNLMRALWKLIRRIPAAMKLVAAWIWLSLQRVGKAVGHVFLRVVAALHTAVAAVLDFFRNITLKDVWNGVCDVADALFRGLPRVLCKVVLSCGALVGVLVVGVFGLGGQLLLFLLEALWYVAKYVPRQLGEIIAGIWSSIAKGYHEIMVWIDPKHL